MSDLGSRLRRVQLFRDERREFERSQRRKEWLYAGIMVGMTLFALLIGVKLGLNDYVEQQFQPDYAVGADGEGEVVFGSPGLKDSFRDRFSSVNETGWCVYGIVDDDRYVVEAVDWIGYYGSGTSVSFSCDRSRGEEQGERLTYFGRVHSHPGRDRARLSETDMENFFDIGGMRFSGVLAADEDGEFVLRWFDRGSLRYGFDVSGL